jgi:hypothetical protein
MTVPVSQADSISLKHDLDITYAHYADLDKDGVEDDIYVNYVLRIRCDDDDDDNFDYNIKMYDIDDDLCDEDDRKVYNLKMDIQYDLKVELVLPSGLERTYFFDLEISIIKDYKETIHLYNNVTEPGWYTAKLTLYYKNYNHWDYRFHKLAYDDIYFDPPIAHEGLPN